MNFFEHQAAARKKTRNLLFLMTLAVLSLVVASNLFYIAALSFQVPEPWEHFTWQTLLLFSVLIIPVVLLGSIFKSVMLAYGGGKEVAESLGARLVNPSTNNRHERRLLNIVEEIAIASGTPVPSVYLLNGERGVNAFAAGVRIKDAVIGVTRGTMMELSRDELEGVIAHEFSHIVNGDMRLNMRLIGVVFGITMLADIGHRLMRIGAFSRSKNAHVFFLAGLGMMVVGSAGAFFGNIIRASVNRTREYLADASAVQFTRNNEGVANALKKIGGSIYGSRLEASHTPEVSHMMFGSALNGFFWNMFRTHPPLDQRIKRLTPRWDGDYIAPKVVEFEGTDSSTAESATSATSSLSVNAAGVGVVTALASSVQAMGAPRDSHFQYARSMIDQMPAALSRAIHHSDEAHCVVMALMLGDEVSVLKKQCDLVASTFSQDTLTQTLKLHELLENAGLLKDHLSILEMTLPALKMLSIEEQQRLKTVLFKLAAADGKTTVMEWSLITIVDHTLPKKKKSANTIRDEKYRNLKQLSGEVSLLIKALVGMSGMSVEDKRACFTETVKSLNISSTGKEKVSFQTLSQGLKKIALLHMDAKEQLLKALCQCIEHDGDVVMKEAQALRAIAVVMDCPVPPLVTGK